MGMQIAIRIVVWSLCCDSSVCQVTLEAPSWRLQTLLRRRESTWYFSIRGMRPAACVCRKAVLAVPICCATFGSMAEANSGCLLTISATSCCVTLRSRRKKRSSRIFLPIVAAAALCSAADKVELVSFSSQCHFNLPLPATAKPLPWGTSYPSPCPITFSFDLIFNKVCFTKQASVKQYKDLEVFRYKSQCFGIPEQVTHFTSNRLFDC